MTIDILATNIQGMGATQLVSSLLPALERVGGERIGTVWLPQAGPLASYRGKAAGYRIYRRRLPNAVSRLLECTLLSSRFGGAPALVLGDLPVSGIERQVILAHSPFLAADSRSATALGSLKAAISRLVLRLNLRWVRKVIVQTPAMHAAMERTYAGIGARLVTIPQPPPQWLLESELHRTVPSEPLEGRGLRLFFPSAAYPHKNHAILEQLEQDSQPHEIERITVTIGPVASNGSRLLERRGLLEPERMLAAYAEADALIFPSLEESYGLPLVEAMHIGIPILCADLPYAHALCGDGAIYFDPRSTASIRQAAALLRDRLDTGWWPDWSAHLAAIPGDWDEVARRMLALFD